jgi:hypothetical protein
MAVEDFLSGAATNIGNAVVGAVGNAAVNLFAQATNAAIATTLQGIDSAVAGNPLLSVAWNSLKGELGSAVAATLGSGLVNLSNGGGWISGNDINVFSNGMYQSLGAAGPDSRNDTRGGRLAGVPDRAVRISGALGKFVFPVTPNITVTHSAKYSSANLTHTIYASQFYDSSDIGQIQISADCPCQSKEEAQSLMAGVFTLRAYTKMYYGKSQPSGSPPPLAFLDGYGMYFKRVPCIVVNVSHTLPDSVDYVDSGSVWVPTLGNISVTLQPIYSRDKIKNFELGKYATGGLVGEGFI